jgi:hypothetical protein
MSPGAALRDLQQAQAGLRKAREVVRGAKEHPGSLPAAFDAGWESLCQAHRVMAAIPRAAADDAVLTKHLAVGRYATALLVRLRRLKRQEAGGSGVISDDDDPMDREEHED